MANKWYVEVNLSNGKALSIGDDYVSGSADLTDDDEHLIRQAANSLLAFVGEPPNTQMHMDTKPCAECEKERKNYPWPPFCKWCGRALSQ